MRSSCLLWSKGSGRVNWSTENFTLMLGDQRRKKKEIKDGLVLQVTFSTLSKPWSVGRGEGCGVGTGRAHVQCGGDSGQHAAKTPALGRCEHRGYCLTGVGFRDANAAACLAVQCGNTWAHLKQAPVAISRSCSVTVQMWGRKGWAIISRSRYLCIRSQSSLHIVLATTAVKMKLWDILTSGCKSSGPLSCNKVWAAASSELLCVSKQMNPMVLLHGLVISSEKVGIWGMRRH